MTGGLVSDWLRTFVEHDLGHWEKHKYFCYKCGNAMQMRSGEHYVCANCKTEYNHGKQRLTKMSDNKNIEYGNK